MRFSWWAAGLARVLRIAHKLTPGIGIDLGTANTLVYVRGRGIILSEPSVVAIDTETGKVHAVGASAKRMVGRTPAHIRAIRPLRDGVIADFDVTEEMLAYFIRQALRRGITIPPRVVVGVPSGITEVERRAVVEAAQRAGAWQTELIDEPMAAAIGAGMPVAEPVGNLFFFNDTATTEIYTLSLHDALPISISARLK